MRAPSLAEARTRLDSGEVSSVELVDAALARAQDCADLCAVVGVRPGAARKEAEAADARRGEGRLRSQLDGVPLVLKDNMVKRGEPTTCGSRILEGFVSPYDATVVEKLEEAGAIVLGRSNMDEFAMGSSTESSCYGPARNPWDRTRICGGSSGGSAAAVAAGIVPAALGSDTGGSIRQPAGLCGVTGLKPSYGRVSRWGLVAFASSLDQIGPLASTAEDCAWLLSAISGHDPRDSTSLPESVPDFAAALTGDVAGLTIGLPRECFVEEGVDGDVLAAVRAGVAELDVMRFLAVGIERRLVGIDLIKKEGVRIVLRGHDAEFVAIGLVPHGGDGVLHDDRHELLALAGLAFDGDDDGEFRGHVGGYSLGMLFDKLDGQRPLVGDRLCTISQYARRNTRHKHINNNNPFHPEDTQA